MRKRRPWWCWDARGRGFFSGEAKNCFSSLKLSNFLLTEFRHMAPISFRISILNFLLPLHPGRGKRFTGRMVEGCAASANNESEILNGSNGKIKCKQFFPGHVCLLVLDDSFKIILKKKVRTFNSPQPPQLSFCVAQTNGKFTQNIKTDSSFFSAQHT